MKNFIPRTILITIITSAASTESFAKWMNFQSSTQEGIKWEWLADPDTFKVRGNIRQIWVMQNAKEIKKGSAGETLGIGSAKRFLEINCEEDTHRFPSVIVYSGPNGTGSILPANSNSLTWEPTPPGSVVSNFNRELCQVKK